MSWAACRACSPRVCSWPSGPSPGGRDDRWTAPRPPGGERSAVSDPHSPWPNSRACTRWRSTRSRRGVTLVGGVGLTVLVLGALWVSGRRWGVAGARAVVLAMAAYAAAALGLDLLTGLAAAVQDRVGWLTVVGTTFVEELGEALSALLVLVTVRWQSPAPGRRRPSA